MENQTKLVASTLIGAVFPIGMGFLMLSDSHRLLAHGLAKSAQHSAWLGIMMFGLAGIELLLLFAVLWYRKQARLRFIREHRPTNAGRARDRLHVILGMDRRNKGE